MTSQIAPASSTTSKTVATLRCSAPPQRASRNAAGGVGDRGSVRQQAHLLDGHVAAQRLVAAEPERFPCRPRRSLARTRSRPPDGSGDGAPRWWRVGRRCDSGAGRGGPGGSGHAGAATCVRGVVPTVRYGYTCRGRVGRVRTMAKPPASDVLGRVTLVTGPESSSTRRTVSAAIAAVRSAVPSPRSPRPTPTRSGWRRSASLAAPSLFSSIRCGGGARPRGPPRGGARRDAGVRRVPGRRHRAGAGALRRPEGHGLLAGARDRHRHRGAVGPPETVGSPASSPPRSAVMAVGSPRTPPTCWCRRSARTCGRSPGRPTAGQRLPQ